MGSRMVRKLSDTEIIVVSDCKTYRHHASTLPSAEDSVMEIGSSTGVATRCLAKTGARVLAVEHSGELAKNLETVFAGDQNVTVLCADARNIPALAEAMSAPTMMFIDIGGDARLDAISHQLRLCLRAFRPRTVVIRNFELATVIALTSSVEPPPSSGLQRPKGEAAVLDQEANLLDLATSSNAQCRIFAARRFAQDMTDKGRDCLQTLLADPDPKVRRTARWALDAAQEG